MVRSTRRGQCRSGQPRKELRRREAGRGCGSQLLRLANLADTLSSSFKRLQRGGAARVAWGRDRASRLCLLLEAPQLAARPSIRTHTPSNTTFNITKLTTPSLHPPLPLP